MSALLLRTPTASTAVEPKLKPFSFRCEISEEERVFFPFSGYDTTNLPFFSPKKNKGWGKALGG